MNKNNPKKKCSKASLNPVSGENVRKDLVLVDRDDLKVFAIARVHKDPRLDRPMYEVLEVGSQRNILKRLVTRYGAETNDRFDVIGLSGMVLCSSPLAK